MTETDALLEHYRPIAGVPDELKNTSGSIRGVWRQFLDHFLALGQEERTARFGRGRQYLRDAGVYYRIYGSSGSAEHDWPLSAVPVLIDGEEWQRITAALEQRADLLERVMADLYGANRLVGEGHLPAALIADNPEWLRPLVGVTPASGHFLHLVGFEIGRGPDGQWWVLGDRTQGPSGLAFALENRVATSRMYAELFAAANVHRLAGFFRVFRDALQNLRRDSGGPIGILTPGPLNDTYFEHAFIARYLGCTLLEGEDLVVEHGQVMVRTVAGPRPISVLWRRIDSAYVDPLELDERSQLGTAGMVEALRQRSLAMINMPGSGLLETRAMLAFLPRICEALLGEPLRMPNIATWWCGQERERAHVQENLASMVVGPALSTRLPFDFEEQTVLGGRSGGRPAEAIRQWIDSQGGTLVGQEAVTLSTTPAWIDNRLQPRPMSLRVFLARTPHGWQAMPGGFARIGRTEDPTAIAMQRGGSAADVWVIGERPVEVETMVASTSGRYARAQPALLPSRAAENLYWLGRYSERAEGALRMVRAWHTRLAESADPDAPLVAWLTGALESFEIDTSLPVPDALRQALRSALGCASRIRDRFAVDGWAALQDLAKTTERFAGRVAAGADAAHAMGVLLRKVSGFSGLVHENMYRAAGWHFLALGRSIERAALMASMLSEFTDPEAPEGALDLAIEVGDSVMTHRRRFAVQTDRHTTIDLLALDPLNPRSILYHLAEVRRHVAELPGTGEDGQRSALARTVLHTHAELAFRTPETLDHAAMLATRQAIWNISDLLAGAYWP